MTSVSRPLQDNSCGKNSWKTIKYSQSYDTVCQLALLGFKGLKKVEYKLTSSVRSLTAFSNRCRDCSSVVAAEKNGS